VKRIEDVSKHIRANGQFWGNDRSTVTASTLDPATLAYPINIFCLIAGVGRQLVYDEINAGRLVAKKVGRRTLIRHADAERWLEAAPAFKNADVGTVYGSRQPPAESGSRRVIPKAGSPAASTRRDGEADRK
jgi:hypothetical protein